MATESSPYEWSEENSPSPSDFLQFLRQICSSPTNGNGESHGAVFANEPHGISDTPSRHPNPSLTDLGTLSVAINYYRCFTSGHLPLQKSLGSASYTLSIQPVYPESLNTSIPGSQEVSTYHCQLRTTLLHEATSTITLRTVALGGISFEGQPISWIVVMELRGNLFALRSDVIAPEELLVEGNEGCDDMELEIISAVPLPEFDTTVSKAVYLGGIGVLDGVDYPGVTVHTGYANLPVAKWESVPIDA